MAICCSCGGGSAAAPSPPTLPSTPSSRRGGIVTGVSFPLGIRKAQRAAPVVRASMVDSPGSSSSDFAKRMEQAWIISQQPGPIVCSTCKSKGHVDCKWCRGTGFFILGDNVLCEVPSRNTSCVICAGKGSASCSDCKGTGFRAMWLGEPPPTKSP